MEVDFLHNITNLHKQKKWKEILELRNLNTNFDFRKLLWVWPSISNLEFIKNVICEFKISGVISIGCGSGLFEWLLEQFSGSFNISPFYFSAINLLGFPVIGYEVNQDWWKSRYSSPQFIQLEFPQQPPNSNTLNPNFALLFCYFNNGEAFRQYINCYDGQIVFIIGPGKNSGRHTDPEPFNPDFGSTKWNLYQIQEVKDTKDFIAVYIKETK